MGKNSGTTPRNFRGALGVVEMTAAVATYTDAREGFATALRRWAGDCKSACKRIARAADCSPRTVENWLAATNGPNYEGLLGLLAESDEVFYEVMRRAGRLPEAQRLDQLRRVEEMLRTISKDAAE